MPRHKTPHHETEQLSHVQVQHPFKLVGWDINMGPSPRSVISGGNKYIMVLNAYPMQCSEAKARDLITQHTCKIIIFCCKLVANMPHVADTTTHAKQAQNDADENDEEDENDEVEEENKTTYEDKVEEGTKSWHCMFLFSNGGGFMC